MHTGGFGQRLTSGQLGRLVLDVFVPGSQPYLQRDTPQPLSIHRLSPSCSPYLQFVGIGLSTTLPDDLLGITGSVLVNPKHSTQLLRSRP
jgi:hypothetical protein